MDKQIIFRHVNKKGSGSGFGSSAGKGSVFRFGSFCRKSRGYGVRFGSEDRGHVLIDDECSDLFFDSVDLLNFFFSYQDATIGCC